MPLKPVFTRDCGDRVHFMDEPMNGLDKEGVKDMRELFLVLKERGKTILVASHSAEDIHQLCDQVWEMEHGKSRICSAY